MPDESSAAPLSQADIALRRAPQVMDAARRGPALNEPLPGRPRAQVRTVRSPDGSMEAHITTEEEIKWLTPDLQRRANALRDLGREVEEKGAVVTRISGGGSIPMLSLVNMRLQALVEMLFPRDTRRGQSQFLDYETSVMQKIMDVLEVSEDQIRQAQLAEGATLPPEALARLAERMGVPSPAAEQRRPT